MIRNLPIDQIDANPNQPRKTFDEAKLRELAESIESEGLIQPITVRRVGDRFLIVAGERRFRAHKLLAEEGRLDPATVTARVRTMTEEEMSIQAVIENLQREDVPALEEAEAFARLVDEGIDVEQIAKRCGVPAFRVRWRLRLLDLDPEIRKMFAAGHLDKQAAMEIARLPESRDQRRVLQMVNRGQLVGWKAVRSAVDAIIDPPAETDQMFAAAPSESDRRTASAMSEKVDRAAKALAGGWKDGECVIASKVNPGEALKTADKLAAMQKMLRHMERELRNTAAGAQAHASDE